MMAVYVMDDGDVCFADSPEQIAEYTRMTKLAGERGRFWAGKLNRARTMDGYMKAYRAMMRERDRIKLAYRTAFLDAFNTVFDRDRVVK